MSSNTFDLDAYCKRINYSGSREPTWRTLQQIHKHHVVTFPFENINTWLQWPVPLDIASLQQKMVGDGRGGYCFEQNLLFMHALQALGFTARGLAARVLSNRPPTARPARTHMLLLVTIDNAHYVADVGFGRFTLSEPLSLTYDVIQPTSHEARRILRAEEEFVMQAQVDDEWRTLYQFSLAKQYKADYKVANWYVCTHPHSHFRQNLTMARVGQKHRYTLRNNTFTTYNPDGSSTQHHIQSIDDMRHILQDHFLLRLPEHEAFHEKLAYVVHNGSPNKT